MARNNYGYMAKIGADTSGLQNALKDINTKLNGLNREMKATDKAISDAMKNGSDSTEMYRQKEAELNEAIEKTEEKLQALRDAEERVRDAAQNGTLNAEEYRAFQREIANCESALSGYRGQLEQLNSANSDNSVSATELNNAFEMVQRSAENVANDFAVVVDAVEKVSGAFVDATKKAVDYSTQVGGSFEAAMSSVQAYSGASAEDFDVLEEAAKKAGATTSKTATEAANALSYMALAGWDTTDMLNGLMPILRASEAGGADLARTSDLVTDSMSAMGIKTEELARYLNIVSTAQSNSNTTMTAMLEAYVEVGGTMRQLNVDIDESATALGVLANRGIKASEAGHDLNSIMVNLMGANKTAKKTLDEIGVSAWNDDGTFKGLRNTLLELSNVFDELDDKQVATLEAKIGGKTQMATLQALISGVREEWSDLNDVLNQSDGQLEQTAQTMQDNLTGSLTIMKSALEGVGVEFYQYLEEPMREVVEAITELLGRLNDEIKSGNLGNSLAELSQKVSDVLTKIIDAAANGGFDRFIKVLTDIVKAVGWVVDNFELLSSVAAEVGVAFAAINIIKTVADIGILVGAVETLLPLLGDSVVATKALGTAMAAIPVVALTTAVAALATGIGWYIAKVEAAKAAVGQMSDEMGDLIDKQLEYNKAINDYRNIEEAANEELEKKVTEAELAIKAVQSLTDGNGKLLGSEKDVKEQLDIINETFGTHYSIIGNQVQGYADLCGSIDGYIGKLKEQIIAEKEYEAFKSAVLAENDLNAQVDVTRSAWVESEKKRQEYVYSSGQTVEFLELNDPMYAQLLADKNHAEAAYQLAVANREANQKVIAEYESAANEKEQALKAQSDYENTVDEHKPVDVGSGSTQDRIAKIKAGKEEEFKAEIEALDKNKALRKNGLDDDNKYYAEKKKIVSDYFEWLADYSEDFWKESDSIDKFYDKQNKGPGKGKSDGKTSSKAVLTDEQQAYEDEVKAIKDKLKQRKIDEETFYKELEEIQKKYQKSMADYNPYYDNQDLIDKHNKALDDADKKAADERKKKNENTAKGQFDKLKEEYDEGLISLAEFNKKYEKLQAVWSKHSIDITDYTSKKVKDIQGKARKADIKEAQDTIDDIVKEYEDLEKQKASITDNMLDLSGKKVTDKNGKERFIFDDYGKEAEKLREYAANYQKVAEFAPPSLMSEIDSMSLSDRVMAVKEIMNMSEAQRQAFLSDWSSYAAAAEQVANVTYGGEQSALDKEATDKIKDMFPDEDTLKAMGYDSAAAYYEGLIAYASQNNLPINIADMVGDNSTNATKAAAAGGRGNNNPMKMGTITGDNHETVINLIVDGAKAFTRRIRQGQSAEIAADA